MELEEMKTLWGEMSAEVEKQKKLTGSLIIRMTEVGYRNKVSKIFVPEAISTVVCFTMVIYILINIQQLNNWYLLACGIISALILLLAPVLSIKAINRLRSLNISGNSYQQTILEYAKAKIQFVTVQKINFYLGALLMLTILPVTVKLIVGKDVFKIAGVWYWYIIAYPFFYFFAKWVYKYYIKTATQAGDLLNELED